MIWTIIDQILSLRCTALDIYLCIVELRECIILLYSNEKQDFGVSRVALSYFGRFIMKGCLGCGLLVFYKKFLLEIWPVIS